MPNIPTSSPPSNILPAGPGKEKKLLDQYSEFLRNRHYSLRKVTVTCCCSSSKYPGTLIARGSEQYNGFKFTGRFLCCQLT